MMLTDKEIAIHEAGHIVTALTRSKTASIMLIGGVFHIQADEVRGNSREFFIEATLSGSIIQELAGHEKEKIEYQSKLDFEALSDIDATEKEILTAKNKVKPILKEFLNNLTDDALTDLSNRLSNMKEGETLRRRRVKNGINIKSNLSYNKFSLYRWTLRRKTFESSMKQKNVRDLIGLRRREIFRCKNREP